MRLFFYAQPEDKSIGFERPSEIGDFLLREGVDPRRWYDNAANMIANAVAVGDYATAHELLAMMIACDKHYNWQVQTASHDMG